MSLNRIQPLHIIQKKADGKKITVLTAYEYSMARILDEAGIDILLIGDSLGNVFSGENNTIPVTMDQMIYHTKAVVKGSQHALVVADMPFLSYQTSIDEAKRNAGRLIKEGGAQAVKAEVTVGTLDAIHAICDIGIPVMGHIGFTPQTVYQLGGNKVQGRDEKTAERLLQFAQQLETFGCFAIVLELMTTQLAEQITKALTIPTIGIGAGKHCDGQVLVTQDMLTINLDKKPKFVKPYVNLHDIILTAVQQYQTDVLSGAFPEIEYI